MSLDRPSVPRQLFYWLLLALLLVAVVAYGLWLVTPVTEPAGEGSGMAVSGVGGDAAAEATSDATLDSVFAAAQALIVGGPTIADLTADPAQLARAKNFLDAVLDARPDSASAHRLLGAWHLASGDPDSARDAFGHSLELEPDSLPTLLWLGSLEFQERNLEAAEARFRQAIEHHPESVEAHNNLGQTLWSQGRETEAEEVYRRKIELANARRDAGSADAAPGEVPVVEVTAEEPDEAGDETGP